jgi:DNA-binding response OmpR family regulator
MPNENIMLVDDEKGIINFSSLYLEEEGFHVFPAFSGAEALDILKKNKIDLIVLDIMLPDIEGTELCLSIRKITDCPIIFASCKSNDIDKVIALGAGGDDYLTKPFSGLELVARIKAHLRRNRLMGNREPASKATLEYQDIKINTDSYEVLCGERKVALSAKEFEILALLMGNPKRIYTVEQIYEAVWKENSLDGDSRTIIVYIGNIRKKIEPDPSNPKFILTVRGVGYKFNSNLQMPQ